MSIPHLYTTHAVTVKPDAPLRAPSSEASGFWGEDGFSFFDLLDIINPLQHIPVVSTIYRAVTGDELSPAARLAGGGILGGIAGLGVAVANLIVEQESGKDIGETALAAWSQKPGHENREPEHIQLASLETPAARPLPPHAGQPPASTAPMPLIKDAPRFYPVSGRAGAAAPVTAGTREALPVLAPLPQFSQEDELFPADERAVEDWYQG